MITKQVIVWCENCERGQLSWPNARVARAELKKHGWSSRRVGGKVLDYCPMCTAIIQKRYHRGADGVFRVEEPKE